MESAGTFLLEIVTPDRKVVDCQARFVSAPGAEGEFGVLAGHTEFITTLVPGEVAYEDTDGKHFLAVAWGYAEIRGDRVVILAENAETAEEIDPVRAEQDRLAWEEKLQEVTQEDENFKVYQAKLHRAAARITVASHLKK